MPKYFLVALCGYAVNFLIYIAMVSANGSVYLANATGFCVGAVLNVLLIRAYVFAGSKFRVGVDIFLTILANGAMLGVGMLVLLVQIGILGVNLSWAKLVTGSLTFFQTFRPVTFFQRK